MQCNPARSLTHTQTQHTHHTYTHYTLLHSSTHATCVVHHGACVAVCTSDGGCVDVEQSGQCSRELQPDPHVPRACYCLSHRGTRAQALYRIVAHSLECVMACVCVLLCCCVDSDSDVGPAPASPVARRGNPDDTDTDDEGKEGEGHEAAGEGLKQHDQ